MPPPLPPRASRPSAPAAPAAQPAPAIAAPDTAPLPPQAYAPQPAQAHQYAAQPAQPPQYAQQPAQPPQYAQQPQQPQYAAQQPAYAQQAAAQAPYAQQPAAQPHAPPQDYGPTPARTEVISAVAAEPPSPAAHPRPAAGSPPARPAAGSPPARPAAGAPPPSAQRAVAPIRPAAGAAAPAPDAPSAPAGHEIAIGTVVAGRYKVERMLGRGGMGAVYAVHHVNTDEKLALKVLNPVLASNPSAVERFRTEARAPVRIGTDHVVRIVDADLSHELGDVPFLVMELLTGRDLGTELKRRGAIPAGEVVLYLRQVARALDKAHAIGIIHRDLKPANLYLTQRDDGSPLVKILDFGIAKLTDGISAELTQDGTIFGTPWYMSPEQARGMASKVGPSVDLWALGLIAFRLLTGRNYWSAEGMAALIGQIVYDPMQPPSQMAPHLGPRFDAWFARACNREPEQRFASATEQVMRLAEALGVSNHAQPTGQFDASQASGYSMGGMSISGGGGMSISGGGMSVPGMSMPGGMSVSGGMGASGNGLSISGAPGGPGASAPGAPMHAAGMSMSATPAPGSTSVPGAAIAASTGAPLSTTKPPVVVPQVTKKRSNGAGAAIGMLAFVILAGGATAGWLAFGHKLTGPAVTANAAQPAEATATAATATAPAATAAAPTATASAAATESPSAAATPEPPAPAPTAEASAPPSGAPVAPLPTLAPAASAKPLGTFAPGAGTFKPAGTGAPVAGKLPPKDKPKPAKPVKIKF